MKTFKMVYVFDENVLKHESGDHIIFDNLMIEMTIN
jgi:ATP-dependent Clp protease ATP-binding subunit ClpA